jgi:hypothetical protein
VIRALVLAFSALTGCMSNGALVVRDVYVGDRDLVVEKCLVKASSDRLVVGDCRVEHMPLPVRVVYVPAPVPAPAPVAEPAGAPDPAR